MHDRKKSEVPDIKLMQSGADEANVVLYKTYYRELYAYILKRVNSPDLARELVQDTFLESFDTIELKDTTGSFLSYSQQIAERRCKEAIENRRQLSLEESEISEDGKKRHIKKIVVGIVLAVMIACLKEMVGQFIFMGGPSDKEWAETSGEAGTVCTAQTTIMAETTGNEINPTETEPTEKMESAETELEEEERDKTVIVGDLQLVRRDSYYEVTGVCDKAASEISIPDEYDGLPVAAIGEGAFQDCFGLTAVSIPDSVRSMGAYAFSGCTSLIEIKVSENVERIEEGTFQGCTRLARVSLPDSITYIGFKTFDFCYNLERVKLPARLEKLEYGAFMFCSNLQEISIAAENGVYSSIDNCLIEKGSGVLVFGCKTSAIPADGSVIYIADYAFCGMGLIEIDIPEGVISVGECAFERNYLNTISIPESLTSIGVNAFRWCWSVREIIVAEGNQVYHSINNKALVETASRTLMIYCINGPNIMEGDIIYIGKYAFYEFSKSDVVISDGVVSIGEFAFPSSNLRSVTIPNSVTYLGYGAFYGSVYLADIIYTGTVEEWEAMEKDAEWDVYTGSYVIHCIDGDIEKQ